MNASITGMAHSWPGTKGRINTTTWRRERASCRDRPSVGAVGNEDAEIRPAPLVKAPKAMRPNRRTPILSEKRAKMPPVGAGSPVPTKEMHGCLGRRDKDGAERRAQLDHGRKGDCPAVVDDGGAEAREEAAARRWLARLQRFSRADGRHPSFRAT